MKELRDIEIKTQPIQRDHQATSPSYCGNDERDLELADGLHGSPF